MALRRAQIPRGPDLKLYRSLRFGRLAEFQVLDTRQYRTKQPCGEARAPICDATRDPDATILGNEQERWLLDRLNRSAATLERARATGAGVARRQRSRAACRGVDGQMGRLSGRSPHAPGIPGAPETSQSDRAGRRRAHELGVRREARSVERGLPPSSARNSWERQSRAATVRTYRLAWPSSSPTTRTSVSTTRSEVTSAARSRATGGKPTSASCPSSHGPTHPSKPAPASSSRAAERALSASNRRGFVGIGSGATLAVDAAATAAGAGDRRSFAFCRACRALRIGLQGDAKLLERCPRTLHLADVRLHQLRREQLFSFSENAARSELRF
jgi:hypothetical protein